MFTRVIYSEISPQIENLIGKSWSKVLALGLMFIIAGMFVLAVPALIVGLIALGLFLAAGVTLTTAYHFWEINKNNQSGEVEVDVEIDLETKIESD